jgi:hypothetical protein
LAIAGTASAEVDVDPGGSARVAGVVAMLDIGGSLPAFVDRRCMRREAGGSSEAGPDPTGPPRSRSRSRVARR